MVDRATLTSRHAAAYTSASAGRVLTGWNHPGVAPGEPAGQVGVGVAGVLAARPADTIQSPVTSTSRGLSPRPAGDNQELNHRLWPLVLRAEEIREHTARIPVILLPSESPPGQVGAFYGSELYRVQGIDWHDRGTRGVSTGAGNEGRGTFGLGYARFEASRVQRHLLHHQRVPGHRVAGGPADVHPLPGCVRSRRRPEAVRIDARYLRAGDDGLTDGNETSSTGWPGPPGRGAPR